MGESTRAGLLLLELLWMHQEHELCPGLNGRDRRAPAQRGRPEAAVAGFTTHRSDPKQTPPAAQRCLIRTKRLPIYAPTARFSSCRTPVRRACGGLLTPLA